ncbi:hypothetical protein [Spirulina sp. 06S082]|uniref:hypothetical protein n=1 Tax=Spirulina sp. 06S082 TaxID=3110248 RepID=UPI002B1E9E8A|nr:hypothetical protein [Spirulina sp. 06S082]MEA5472437.1 hypothetical protein [Spirulina sp. 06S082]
MTRETSKISDRPPLINWHREINWRLMPEIRQLEDMEQLEAILTAIKSIEAIAQLRQICQSFSD